MLILRRRRKRRAPGVGTLKSSISRRALSQFDRVLLAALGGTHSYVQRFHTQRECHGEVDVAFWYVDIKGFGDQNRSNNDQEGKREYLERGMTLDKRTDGTCSNHHDHDRDHNRCDHDGYMVDHADSCDYGIQREHDVDDRNLDDGSNEVPGGAFGLAILVFALHAVIDLGAAFPEKEKAAEEQDQIAARYPLAEEMEQIRRKPHDPADRQEKRDPRDHCEREAEEPSPRLHMGWHSTHQNRNHDDVVDAQYDLQRRQRKKRDPDFRAGEPFHFLCFLGVQYVCGGGV